jgi:hypothetical protein
LISARPLCGDVVGCTDGDIGVVLSTNFDEELGDFRVEVSWSKCGQVLIDPWHSTDYSNENNLFWVMSRA